MLLVAVFGHLLVPDTFKAPDTFEAPRMLCSP